METETIRGRASAVEAAGSAGNGRVSDGQQYPRTEWEGQPVTWKELGWQELHRSLPTLEATKLTNGQGAEHPHNAWIRLVWPAGGRLTTAGRQAWSGHAIGAGRRSGILHPRQLAESLAGNCHGSSVGTPDLWHTGWTPCGDWWALRALWDCPASHPAGSGPVQVMVTIEHEICTGRLSLHAGWRDRQSGAEIVSRHWRVRARRGELILHWLRGSQVIEAAMQVLQQTTDILKSWSTEGMERGTLIAWAAAVAGPRFGRDMPARLLRRFDRHREADGEDGRNASLRLNSVRDIAWALAERTLEELDISRRMVIQGNIVEAVADLPWWNAPQDPDGVLPRPTSDPSRVH